MQSTAGGVHKRRWQGVITTAVSKAALQGKTVSFHLRVPGSVSGASPWGPLVNDGPEVKLVDEAAR